MQYAIVAAGAVLIAALVYIDLPGLPSDTTVASSTIELKGQAVSVFVADTPEERERGLSGWSGLADGEGMLFVFAKDDRYAFWMKDMLFSIDILWLSKAGMIVHREENVASETYPTAFAPSTEARYVVELPAGYVAEHAIQVGDFVRL